MNKLGFGFMRLPLTDPADQTSIDIPLVERMADCFFDAGFTYCDTAWMYHDFASESAVGRAVVARRPRGSFSIASKMPVGMIRSHEEGAEVFATQKARLGVDYFDHYLVHNMNVANYAKARRYGMIPFLREKRASGEIRRLGFSCHDNAEYLDRVLGECPFFEFVQIQLNYLDWETYRSREQYEVLTKLGIPVLVMEPLRGGALATLSPQAVDFLKQSNPNATPASWGLRWVASLPNVICTLSGMSHPDQLEDNIATFTPMSPLSDAEKKTLAAALDIYRNSLDVPCTGCNYCQPCPFKVEIPRIFAYWNQYQITHSAMLLKGRLSTIPEGSTADACVGCKSCLSKCPQHIDIPANLARIANSLKTL
jgi:predicted aldo/keto reductase-like oxidoreductase